MRSHAQMPIKAGSVVALPAFDSARDGVGPTYAALDSCRYRQRFLAVRVDIRSPARREQSHTSAFGRPPCSARRRLCLLSEPISTRAMIATLHFVAVLSDRTERSISCRAVLSVRLHRLASAAVDHRTFRPHRSFSSTARRALRLAERRLRFGSQASTSARVVVRAVTRGRR